MGIGNAVWIFQRYLFNCPHLQARLRLYIPDLNDAVPRQRVNGAAAILQNEGSYASVMPSEGDAGFGWYKGAPNAYCAVRPAGNQDVSLLVKSKTLETLR